MLRRFRGFFRAGLGFVPSENLHAPLVQRLRRLARELGRSVIGGEEEELEEEEEGRILGFF